eukprot:CAMPEP_0197824170 /NCGR_PEP_ID=MMETSP1437-20131217/1479_1 /TAXON_ID=49252 ORGANISM="Eucampia antarctica, Strain CCMP1452" /NCGR_SAMPLE_ID=MMETSP1437 /ASSEMBLY_ACC=CAM_ASM_001096 /LENGTH=196 /DNA_ID=CAMNT_0043423711 /DNA_START=57 /DNA_END=647 /DNA_ORIENTATION=+
MKSFNLLVIAVSLLSKYTLGFAPPSQKYDGSFSMLNMAKEDNGFDMMRFSRSQRSANVDDRVVELKRPLGLVLDEDENGNVVVETVAPRGNAARTGQVKEGDIVTMCSATFGDQMWSTRGAGLQRVLAAIRVRAGPTVKLALESSSESTNKVKSSTKAAKAAVDARLRAQQKKDELLKELESDEKKLKKGKFLGLF